MQTRVIRFHETGGPEVLRLETVDLPDPGPGEARVRHHAVGVNFIDTYHRSGLYALPLPAGLGMEGAGVVEAVGAGVTDVQVGDRVAYAGRPPGAYAEARNLPADRLVRLPDEITEEQAAAMMLKGLTVEYLLRRTYAVQPDETILWHAAAGGVGLIACQWASHLGARVIGTVSTAAKAEIARAHGCARPVVTSEEDFVAVVEAETGGHGVGVVYDSVGADTFMRSLDCLRPRGTMVSFGQSSGPVPPLDVRVLSEKGSLYLTRPSLMTYTARRADLLAGAAGLFDVVRAEAVRVEVRQRFPLSEAARAHAALEARKTTGSTVLFPEGKP